MLSLIQEALSKHPMTCAILTLYASNIAWYLSRREWGLACYWLAAAQITFAATWLPEWKGAQP